MEEYIRSFTSKKNRVQLKRRGNEEYILKEYTNPDSCEREAAVYAGLKKTPHARYIRTGALSAEMEYINAPNFVDVLEEFERTGADACPVFMKLFDWLGSFHSETGLIMADDNLRNFLLREGEVIGIDFEDCTEGEPIFDLAAVTAYVLTYNPPYTDYKCALAERLAEYEEGIAREAMKIISVMCERRKNLPAPPKNLFLKEHIK